LKGNGEGFVTRKSDNEVYQLATFGIDKVKEDLKNGDLVAKDTKTKD
jgi:hypothetical protein